MKNFKLTVLLIPLLVVTSCFVDKGINVQSIPNLVKEGFISDTEYEIVCLGLPKAGLHGVQKEESAKRAALLNAYYYSKNRFDNTVNPDQDGKIDKFVMFEDHGELRYIITKSNLKKRVKK